MTEWFPLATGALALTVAAARASRSPRWFVAACAAWGVADVTRALSVAPLTLAAAMAAMVGVALSFAGAPTAHYAAAAAVLVAGLAPWPAAQLAARVLTVLAAAWALRRALRDAAAPDLQTRAALLLAGVAVGALTRDVAGLPALAFVPAAALALAPGGRADAPAWWTRDRQLLAWCVGAAFVAAVGLAGGAHLARTSRAWGVAAALAVAVVAALSARPLVTRYQTERARLRQLAVVGRFAAQMAHDLKNPLSVLTGAAQFLQEEHARGSSFADYGEFLDLMVQELARMRRLLDGYERLGRVEVQASRVDVNALVRDVLSLQAFATSGRVAVEPVYGAALPEVSLDRDLLENALKNLVRNAFEAMPARGTVRVTTARGAPVEGGVVITVEDTGEGMDAPTLERALESFYTTRPTGSGLGLAFVRRVVDAHHGTLSLTSHVGRGTVVRVWLPSTPGEPVVAKA